MSADNNNAVWKLGYITDVLKMFRDGAKISDRRRTDWGEQAIAYADDVIAAIAALRLEVADARRVSAGSEAPE